MRGLDPRIHSLCLYRLKAWMAGEMLNRTAVGNREQVPEMTDTTRVPVAGLVPATHVLEGGCVARGKPWMTGTSPVKGTRSCSRVAANNRFPSTGQPWDKRGQDETGRRFPHFFAATFPPTALRNSGRGAFGVTPCALQPLSRIA